MFLPAPPLGYGGETLVSGIGTGIGTYGTCYYIGYITSGSCLFSSSYDSILGNGSRNRSVYYIGFKPGSISSSF